MLWDQDSGKHSCPLTCCGSPAHYSLTSSSRQSQRHNSLFFVVFFSQGGGPPQLQANKVFLCSVLSSPPGSTPWFSSSAWRMRSASRQSTITLCAYRATGTQLRSLWSSSEHKVLTSNVIHVFIVIIVYLFLMIYLPSCGTKYETRCIHFIYSWMEHKCPNSRFVHS